MANGCTHTEFYYTALQIWTKDVQKRTILRTDVLSHQISSPTPKITCTRSVEDASMNDLELPLTETSRARLYATLNISETLQDRYMFTTDH